MTKCTIFLSLSILYAYIAICSSDQRETIDTWISSLTTFKEPNSQPLSHIVKDGDHIFVAGRNVLYRLESELDRPVKLVTGPEPDHPQCFLDQPCDAEKQMTDNENQVLDILDSYPFDRERRMLLVCGTVYHGLCQLRGIGNISEYRWIKPYNDSLGFSIIRPSPYRKTCYQTDFYRNVTIWWSALHDDPAVRTPSSPPFLSKKVLVEKDNDFRFEYESTNGSVDSTLRFEGNSTRYVLESFQHQLHVYFVILHTSREGQITTRLGRVCHDVQSYIEMTIACDYRGKRDYRNRLHDRATTAYYGRPTTKMKMDRHLDDDDHMLYVSLANYEGEEVSGQVIAGFSMRAVEKAFDSNESGCLAAQDPIAGVDCHSSRKYTHPKCGMIDSPRLMNQPYMSNIVVVHVGPMLPSSTISAARVLEQKGIGIAIIGTSNGIIFKANLDQGKMYSFHSILDQNESKAGVTSPLTLDKNGLHIYVVIKNKVVKYPLYSCSAHPSCPRCIVNGGRMDPLECVWCNGRCTQAFECEDSTALRNDSCPPFIKQVTSEYSEVKKGMAIKISGHSFGLYVNSSNNNVTVTNLNCQVETWNNTQVTCTLATPPKCEPIPTVRLSSSSPNSHTSSTSTRIFGSDAQELNLTEYRFPKLYAMFPSKGPKSGGTHVILYGENLDTYSHRVINVRGRRCIEMAINEHAAWCITDQTESPELNDTISFRFGNNVFKLEETVPDSFNLTGKYRNFKYLPDPQIYQIQPGITTIRVPGHAVTVLDILAAVENDIIIKHVAKKLLKVWKEAFFESGLMNVTVVGRHLDSVETPEMVVRVALSQSENVLEFKEACWSDPDSKGSTLTCRTPLLRHPGLPLPTRTFPLVTHVNFLMDGVEELKNLHTTREVMSRLMYYPDPEITPFRGIVKVLDNGMMLEIKGRHLDLINNPDNLHVRIGDHELCIIKSLHPTSLQCELPPMLRSHSSVLGTNFTVEVIVGVSSKTVGVLSIIENRSSGTPAWVLAVIIGGSCIVVGILVWYCRRNKTKKSLADLTLTVRNESGNQYTREAVAPSRVCLSVAPSPCEKVPLIANMEPPLVERETFQLIKEERLLIDLPLLFIGQQIGSGHYGCVNEGLLRSPKDGTETKVAVKSLRNINPLDASEKIADFLQEALVMKDFKHPNVLSLIGISFEEGLPLVVLPYMENGDLCKYLREHSKVIMKSQLMKFAIDVATGMAYLAKCKFVHRDLAARNCILNSNLNVRVADFGLSRDIYEKDYYSSHDTKAKLPCKWMAPESMEKGVYSEATDVWSYGVLLWELMTYGRIPYANVIGWDILPYLKLGRRLSQPEDCPDDLYALMQECWKEDPNERPCFEEIKVRVSRISTELIEEDRANATNAVQNPDYM